ncbi:MAG: hypothetical protein AB1611_14590 [bacterium]
MEKSHQIIMDDDLWNELKVLAAKERKSIKQKLTEIIENELRSKYPKNEPKVATR